MIGRTYLDPGDRLSGRRTPPTPVTVLRRWGTAPAPLAPLWLLWARPPRRAPRNVLVERPDGSQDVIPFPRRLRRPREDHPHA